MADYPTGVYSQTAPTASDDLDTAGVEHDVLHAEAIAEIAAVETELGVSPSGDHSDVAGRLDFAQRAAADVVDYSFDVDLFSGPAPSAAQVVPTPASPSGGQGTHPSVLFVPQGFGGYRYWMAFTPYPASNDAVEDPCVVASIDGDSWEVPAGLTNPLDDQPGSPGAYNSDTDLMLGPDGLLYLFWRTYDVGATGVEEHLYVRTSADGVTWTAKATVLTADASVERLLSPTVVWDQGVWHLWTVDAVPSPNVIRHRTASSPTGSWSAGAACTAATPSGKEPWHLSVRRFGGGFVGVLNDTATGTNGTEGDLLLISSTDGESWAVSTAPVVPRSASGLYDKTYRASMVPTVRDGLLGLDVWFGAYLSTTTTWGIYRTHLTAAATSGGGSYVGVNEQTGTSYSLVGSDVGKLVTLTNVAGISVSLPSDAATTFPVGGRADFAVMGDGMASFIPGSGATVKAPGTATTRAKYSTVTATKYAANSWLMSGDLDPTIPTLTYEETILADTPEVYYRFQETSGTTAADSSGNSRPATYSGSPTLGAPGPVDKALTLDGVDDYTSTTEGAWLTDSNADSFSVEIWYKGAGGNGVLAAKNGSDGGWMLFTDVGPTVKMVVKQAATGQATVSAGIADSAWHHIVTVWTAGAPSIYVDGAVVTPTLTSAGNTFSTNYPLTIGKRGNGTPVYSTGAVAEFAYYSYALSASQIADHYAAATA